MTLRKETKHILTDVPERQRERECVQTIENIFEDIVHDNFLNFTIEVNIQIQEEQYTLRRSLERRH